MKLNSFFRRKNIDSVTEEIQKTTNLEKVLSLRDLTFIGIAAIVGAGIFGTIGEAAVSGGPAVSLLFVFTAFACLLSALCYAEFASTIPVSGSAYTYAYVSFGELIAWIIGWDLLMEYAIGNIAVAISWSGYFISLLKGFGITIPAYLTTDYISAKSSSDQVQALIDSGKPLSEISSKLLSGFQAWNEAPLFFNIKIVLDLPALFITIIITWLVLIGIKESKNTGNILVLIKLVILAIILAVGVFYVHPENYSVFAPNGFGGVMSGVSSVFFAYIGFDAISTTAEECKNPGKDMPKAMMFSLLICTVLYVLITLVLTGMVKYSELGVEDPLAFAFSRNGLNFLSYIISFSAVIAMASVLLVFQLGQPRIWMNMSRDGLLPAFFSKIHPRYKTPYISTLITGLVVGLGTLFFNLKEVTDLTSIGTLFAFALVCGGILIKPSKSNKGFKVPYYNSRYIAPAVFGGLILLILFNWNASKSFAGSLAALTLYLLYLIILGLFAYRKNLSLIPLAGLSFNVYLLGQLGELNWLRFLIWLGLGLIIYFLYSRKNSVLEK